MAALFFHAVNCNRNITSKGLRFQFEPYALSGTWLGIYKAEKPDEQEALTELTHSLKSGVTSISKEEFDSLVKKKLRETLGAYTHLKPESVNPEPLPKTQEDAKPAEPDRSEAEIEEILKPRQAEVAQDGNRKRRGRNA